MFSGASNLYAGAKNFISGGNAFGRGVGQAFGIAYEGKTSLGFLGRKGSSGIFSQAGLSAGFGLGFTLLNAYSAYREGGITGMAGQVASDAAMWGVGEMAFSAISNPLVMTGAGIGAAAYGGYKLGQAGIKHRKRLRNVEMGGGLIDNFGTMNTMRQRSLAAIQNTHLGSRSALGNEAMILAQYRR